jgi:hypothetical protein
MLSKSKSVFMFTFLLAFNSAVFCQYQEEISKIVVYRDASPYAAAVSYKLLIDHQFQVKLRNNSYYEFTCVSGMHNISIDGYKQFGLDLNVKPGNTYYVRFGIKMGVWISTPELILVDSLSALPTIENGNMYNLNDSDKAEIRTKNYIGFSGVLGFGTNNIPLLTTTEGKESKLSFGGGFGIGLNYGYQINRYFDLSFGMNYQISQLIPYLSNADISFSRGMLSFTPSLIIPIDGGYSMKLKLGGGINKAIGTKLSIDTREISDGIKDDWKYNNPFGFHLEGQFEMFLSNYWSLVYSIKYYNIIYEYESNNYGYFPTEVDLGNPDGSGIDLRFGIYYHF